MTRNTALVTGASSGIGLELARLLARDGHDLVLVGRDETRLRALASELTRTCGVTALEMPQDLCHPRAADRIAEQLEARAMSVDVLVNSAGFNIYGRFDRTDGEDELRMLNVNVVALTRLTKLLLPCMIERGFGRVLNVGSTGSFAPGPFDAVYCASKAYVLSLTEALAEELEGTGVTVTALCPGATATRFADRAGMAHTPMFRGRLADPSVVARVGYHAMVTGRRVVIPGLMNALMTQSIRFSPRTMVASISKHMLVGSAGTSA